jgi:hypothetical protein
MNIDPKRRKFRADFLAEHALPPDYIDLNVGRRELVEILTKHGYPIKYQTLTTKCMPKHARSRGPPVEFFWGNLAIHNAAEGLYWAFCDAMARTQEVLTRRAQD